MGKMCGHSLVLSVRPGVDAPPSDSPTRPIDYETTSIDGIGFKLGLGPMGHDGVYRHGYTLNSSFPITTPCFVISATDPHSTLIVA